MYSKDKKNTNFNCKKRLTTRNLSNSFYLMIITLHYNSYQTIYFSFHLLLHQCKVLLGKYQYLHYKNKLRSKKYSQIKIDSTTFISHAADTRFYQSIVLDKP